MFSLRSRARRAAASAGDLLPHLRSAPPPAATDAAAVLPSGSPSPCSSPPRLRLVHRSPELPRPINTTSSIGFFGLPVARSATPLPRRSPVPLGIGVSPFWTASRLYARKRSEPPGVIQAPGIILVWKVDGKYAIGTGTLTVEDGSVKYDREYDFWSSDRRFLMLGTGNWLAAEAVSASFKVKWPTSSVQAKSAFTVCRQLAKELQHSNDYNGLNLLVIDTKDSSSSSVALLKKDDGDVHLSSPDLSSPFIMGGTVEILTKVQKIIQQEMLLPVTFDQSKAKIRALFFFLARAKLMDVGWFTAIDSDKRKPFRQWTGKPKERFKWIFSDGSCA